MRQETNKKKRKIKIPFSSSLLMFLLQMYKNKPVMNKRRQCQAKAEWLHVDFCLAYADEYILSDKVSSTGT